MDRRRFLAVGAGALAFAAACSGDDDVDQTGTTITTLAGPGAGAADDVLLRTGAALSLAGAAVHERAGGELAIAAADAHRVHAETLDPSVREPHADALASWAAPLDAELAIAATFQAWAVVLSTAPLRLRIMSAGASAARLYIALRSIELGMPTLPEAFQLVDPAVPDEWLLSAPAGSGG
jgi:hypothetical protein